MKQLLYTLSSIIISLIAGCRLKPATVTHNSSTAPSESAYQKLEGQAGIDTNRVKALIQKGDDLMKIYPDSVLPIYHEALNISYRTGYQPESYGTH